MGVKGLTTFIDENPSLLQDFKLHDCKVILDGNNFVHFVYQQYNTTFQYDGDYFHYYQKIVQLFKNLQSCNIIPYVVFDGGYDVSDSKLRTLMQRADSRVKQAVNNSSLLPILANKVFLKVLDELKVPHVTCSFEADEEIAILANHWKCAVISNDSDFFVYKLKAGFLPLNYVDFRPITEHECTFISVQKYHFDHFEEILDNFQPEMIPLLATILGNDFIKRETFMAFTEKFEKPKYKIKYATKSVSKITAIVSYFDNFESFDEVKAAVTKDFVTNGGVASLQHVIDKSIQCYTKIEHAKSYLADYFCEKLDTSSLDRNDYFGRPFPKWLITSLLNGAISPSIQNMAILHRMVLPSQNEDIIQSSSHKISKHIRQVLYGIMFQGAMKENRIVTKVHKKAKVTKECYVEEVDRIGKGISQIYTDPRMNVMDYGKLPSLSEIENLSLHSRRDIILKTLCASEKFLSNFCPSHHLLMAVIGFWVYHSQVSKQHLEALILSIIQLKIRNLVNDEKSDKKPTENLWTNTFLKIFVGVITFIPRLVLRFLTNPFQRTKLDIDTILKPLTTAELININLDLNVQTGSKKARPDTLPNQILHFYSQYQSCLLFTILLNEVLLSPLEEPTLWEIYDGLCVFHFNHCLTDRHNGCYGDVDVLSALENHPKLVNLYKSITQIVMCDVKSRPQKMTKSQRRNASKFTLRSSLVPVSLLIIGILVCIIIVMVTFPEFELLESKYFQ